CFVSDLLRNTDNNWLVYTEDPRLERLSGSWSMPENGAWRVPDDCDSGELCEWLYLGNWILYNRATAMERDRVRKLCDNDEDWLADALVRNDVGYVVSAFHDNARWTIALHPYRQGQFDNDLDQPNAERAG